MDWDMSGFVGVELSSCYIDAGKENERKIVAGILSINADKSRLYFYRLSEIFAVRQFDIILIHHCILQGCIFKRSSSIVNPFWIYSFNRRVAH